MSEESLHDYFQSRKARANGGPPIDWDKKKRDWLTAIDALYKDIREKYLADSIRDGLVTLSTSAKTIREDYLGEYEAPELTVSVGDERVVFSPKGRNVVGAAGRIDLHGSLGERTIVAQPDRWGIVIARTPTLRVVPLDSTSLLQAIKDVMGR